MVRPSPYRVIFHVDNANVKTFTDIVPDEIDGMIGQATGSNKIVYGWVASLSTASRIQGYLAHKKHPSCETLP